MENLSPHGTDHDSVRNMFKLFGNITYVRLGDSTCIHVLHIISEYGERFFVCQCCLMDFIVDGILSLVFLL